MCVFRPTHWHIAVCDTWIVMNVLLKSHDRALFLWQRGRIWLFNFKLRDHFLCPARLFSVDKRSKCEAVKLFNTTHFVQRPSLLTYDVLQVFGRLVSFVPNIYPVACRCRADGTEGCSWNLFSVCASHDHIVQTFSDWCSPKNFEAIVVDWMWSRPPH